MQQEIIEIAQNFFIFISRRTLGFPFPPHFLLLSPPPYRLTLSFRVNRAGPSTGERISVVYHRESTKIRGAFSHPPLHSIKAQAHLL
jgi:hypothetical protein